MCSHDKGDPNFSRFSRRAVRIPMMRSAMTWRKDDNDRFDQVVFGFENFKSRDVKNNNQYELFEIDLTTHDNVNFGDFNQNDTESYMVSRKNGNDILPSKITCTSQ